MFLAANVRFLHFYWSCCVCECGLTALSYDPFQHPGHQTETNAVPSHLPSSAHRAVSNHLLKRSSPVSSTFDTDITEKDPGGEPGRLSLGIRNRRARQREVKGLLQVRCFDHFLSPFALPAACCRLLECKIGSSITWLDRGF